MGGRRAGEGMGAGVHWYLTAKGAKTAKNPTALALRPLRSLRCSISQIIYFNSRRQRTNTTSIPYSGTAGYPFIHKAPKKRLPAPHHKAGQSRDQDGHPDKVKARGGRQESERRDGGWNSLVSHRKVRKDRKGFYCHGFASFVVQYFINNIF